MRLTERNERASEVRRGFLKGNQLEIRRKVLRCCKVIYFMKGLSHEGCKLLKWTRSYE